MALTVNGHHVIETKRMKGPYPRLRKWIVPGTGRTLLLRDGAMGFLLVHVAVWFHDDVERLNITDQPWDEWGWAVRPVRGQTTGFSNHAGGVACDLNATLHPRGVPTSRTFTPRQIARIQRRVRWYRGTIIWGGVWHMPDAMHFEIAPVTLRKCERVARFMMRTPRGKRILAANPGARDAILS